MKKVAIKVVKEVKVDGRKNNTGRPVNKKSARQIRLNNQKATKQAMDYVVNGGWFKLTPFSKKMKGKVIIVAINKVIEAR